MARKTARESRATRARGGEAKGAVRVRRETAARTVRAEGPHSTEVRQRIDEAVKAGLQLRREIEQRIETGLRKGRSRQAPAGGRRSKRG
ncbi:MAG: hypothetical protein WBV82_16655 [Myxococcaceae bacterium]